MVFEPRIVDITDVNDTTHPTFAQVIYDINHIVRDIEPHPDTLLIFEVQIPAPKPVSKAKRKEELGHTGYLLTADSRGITKVGPKDDFSDYFDRS